MVFFHRSIANLFAMDCSLTDPWNRTMEAGSLQTTYTV